MLHATEARAVPVLAGALLALCLSSGALAQAAALGGALAGDAKV